MNRLIRYYHAFECIMLKYLQGAHVCRPKRPKFTIWCIQLDLYLQSNEVVSNLEEIRWLQMNG